MSKKKYQYRIEKKADGVYIIKERHTFMFFWSFWTTGSIRFKIAKQYASPQLAEDAIVKAAQERGVDVFIMNVDNAKSVLSKLEKKAKKKQRKTTRAKEEKERNLRRIGKIDDEMVPEKKPIRKTRTKKTE